MWETDIWRLYLTILITEIAENVASWYLITLSWGQIPKYPITAVGEILSYRWWFFIEIEMWTSNLAATWYQVLDRNKLPYNNILNPYWHYSIAVNILWFVFRLNTCYYNSWYPCSYVFFKVNYLHKLDVSFSWELVLVIWS